jgi:hypothetical protein
LDRIAEDARRGQFPVLHFETHGVESDGNRASPGIVLASDEAVTWQDLAPRFTTINEATRLQLIVFMAACNGADLATVIRPLGRAPVRLIVGPMNPVSAGAVERATRAFYATLLRDGNNTAAIRAINEALRPDEAGFWSIPAEILFLEILKAYYNELTTDEQIAARVESRIAALVLSGSSPAEIERRREVLTAELNDRAGLFDSCYQRFFFVDQYPESANRFILSFERCFQEADR